MAITRVLFVCSQNKLRSPTAEQVFSTWPGIEVSSAGLNNDAEEPLTSEIVRDADLIFVMEKAHRNRLSKRFKADIGRARVICLDIPDDYDFMDPELVKLLTTRVPPHLPR
ncbi:MAG TPA: low molecular weight protein tyrosine phosphatase family protein [Caulobacter sp.]|nr:low molecular weight protein tyrosine phosphatase family protein [Caulobacter sp.]